MFCNAGIHNISHRRVDSVDLADSVDAHLGLILRVCLCRLRNREAEDLSHTSTAGCHNGLASDLNTASARAQASSGGPTCSKAVELHAFWDEPCRDLSSESISPNESIIAESWLVAGSILSTPTTSLIGSCGTLRERYGSTAEAEPLSICTPEIFERSAVQARYKNNADEEEYVEPAKSMAGLAASGQLPHSRITRPAAQTQAEVGVQGGVREVRCSAGNGTLVVNPGQPMYGAEGEPLNAAQLAVLRSELAILKQKQRHHMVCWQPHRLHANAQLRASNKVDLI